MRAYSMSLMGCLFVLGALRSAAQDSAQGPHRTQEMVFPSPERGAEALVQAAKAGDVDRLTQIVGLEPGMLQTESDSIDVGARGRFVEKYEQMHRVVREPGGSAELYIGAEDWPFPVPLDSSNGVWHFDSEAGKLAVLHRRIGQNELIAIAVCRELAVGTVHVGAIPKPFHGYAFRALPLTHKGFLAYPVAYRSSGVMTFLVDDQGIVYQRDNGPESRVIARGMSTASPDATWEPADEPAAAASIVPMMRPY